MRHLAFAVKIDELVYSQFFCEMRVVTSVHLEHGNAHDENHKTRDKFEDS